MRETLTAGLALLVREEKSLVKLCSATYFCAKEVPPSLFRNADRQVRGASSRPFWGPSEEISVAITDIVQ
jgi:hypothetical protein